MIKSKKVMIKQVSDRRIRRGKGDNPEFYHKRVGGSLNGANCLTEEEKRALLPDLIKTHPTSADWNKNVNLYFNNISKEIPFIGLELEVGFNYDNEEDAKKDLRKVSEGCKPINTADFVFYKHCLEYSRVANKYEDINKSFNIEFYIEDKETLIKREKMRSTDIMKARRYSLMLVDNPSKLDNVLLLYGYSPESMSDDEKFVIAEQLCAPDTKEKDPENTKIKQFIQFNEDDELLMKAFIQRCMNVKVLYKLANTETIMYDTPDGKAVRLGLSIEDAITFLSKSEQSDLYTKITTSLDFVYQQRGLTYKSPGQNEKVVVEKKEEVKKKVEEPVK